MIAEGAVEHAAAGRPRAEILHRRLAGRDHVRLRVVEAQRIEPRIDRLGPRNPAMPVDARRADIFGLAEQLLAAISADDIAQDPAEIADVGVLADRGGGSGVKVGHVPMLRCKNPEVKGVRGMRAIVCKGRAGKSLEFVTGS